MALIMREVKGAKAVVVSTEDGFEICARIETRPRSRACQPWPAPWPRWGPFYQQGKPHWRLRQRGHCRLRAHRMRQVRRNDVSLVSMVAQQETIVTGQMLSSSPAGLPGAGVRMKADEVQAAIEELGQFPGMDGCALVDAETGMPWHHAGSAAGVERVAEAAIEFWRVQTRLSRHFEGMGHLQSAAYSFSNRVVALFPCGEAPPLVLVLYRPQERCLVG